MNSESIDWLEEAEAEVPIPQIVINDDDDDEGISYMIYYILIWYCSYHFIKN